MSRLILLVGFEPVGKKKESKSEKIANALHKLDKKGYRIVGKVLPIRYFEVEPNMLEFLHILKPRIVLIIDETPKNKIILDKYAGNIVLGKFDDEEVKWSKIVRGLPEDYLFESNLPIYIIQEALVKNKIPVAINNLPGKFIGNFAYAIMMNFLMKNKINIPAGLIRIPSKNKSLSYEAIIDAIDIALDVSVQALPSYL
ncbi:MAG: pyroglutamyl-peptidase I family protein [Promethearchaeota archaeon]